MARPSTRFVQAGQRFGRGVVIDPEIRIVTPSKPRGFRGARLRCACGTEYAAYLSSLLIPDGKGTVSCGCLRRETARQRGSALSAIGMPLAAAANRTHGLRLHLLYSTWGKMLRRCENPDDHKYRDYGARGIRVCDRWHDARLFVEDIDRDLGPRPDGMTLDRINNDGNYEPGNVRWATAAQQTANRRPRRKAA